MELLKSARLLGEPGRARIARLLAREELSVADLQEILGMAQSRISMQLAQLRSAGLLSMRRSGQRSLYRLAEGSGEVAALVRGLLRHSAADLPEAAHDDAALALVLEARKDTLRGYFDGLAGRFGQGYVPGRSWRALTEMALRLLPPLDIADLGAGEGTLSLMLARGARRVIAVDSARKMVEYGAGVAQRSGVENLEYRLGDLESLPIAGGEVDLALMHQALHHALHPQQAVSEAARILRPGGRIVVMELLRHDFEAARDLYADVWLGFSLVELTAMLGNAGFEQVTAQVVDREADAPQFEIVLAMGRLPG